MILFYPILKFLVRKNDEGSLLTFRVKFKQKVKKIVGKIWQWWSVKGIVMLQIDHSKLFSVEF